MKKNKIIAITVAILSCMSISSIGVSAESSTITTNTYSKNDVLLTDTFGFNTVKDGTIMLSGECGDNATWSIDTDMTLTISGTGAMADYNFDSYNYKDNSPWYDYRNNIKNIVVTDGITRIGNFAFYECDNLEAVTLTDDIKTIGSSAFAYTNIKSITLPKNLISIDNSNSADGAFVKCTSLKEVVCNENLVSIGDYAFQWCFNLEKVTFNEGLTSIGYRAFESCSIQTLVFPNSLTSIESDAFMGVCACAVVLPNNQTVDLDNSYSINYDYNGDYKNILVIPPKVTEVDSDILTYNSFTVFGVAGTQAQFFAILNGLPFIETEFDENGKPLRSIEELQDLAYQNAKGYPITTEPLVTTESIVTTTTSSTTEIPIDDGKIYDNCDCNRDGVVNILDLIYLKKRLFGLI